MPELEKRKEKQTSDFFFLWKLNISVEIVYRSTDFKAKLTNQLVRLVTETSQVVLFVFILSVLLILFLLETF